MRNFARVSAALATSALVGSVCASSAKAEPAPPATGTGVWDVMVPSQPSGWTRQEVSLRDPGYQEGCPGGEALKVRISFERKINWSGVYVRNVTVVNKTPGVTLGNEVDWQGAKVIAKGSGAWWYGKKVRLVDVVHNEPFTTLSKWEDNVAPIFMDVSHTPGCGANYILRWKRV